MKEIKSLTNEEIISELAEPLPAKDLINRDSKHRALQSELTRRLIESTSKFNESSLENIKATNKLSAVMVFVGFLQLFVAVVSVTSGNFNSLTKAFVLIGFASLVFGVRKILDR